MSTSPVSFQNSNLYNITILAIIDNMHVKRTFYSLPIASIEAVDTLKQYCF